MTKEAAGLGASYEDLSRDYSQTNYYSASPALPAIPPRLGAFWPGQGGIYAGIVRGLEGANDCHLIVGPEFDGVIAWDTALIWAANLRVDGHSDFCLPLRREQRFLFCNAGDQYKSDWYWSSEQHAAGSGFAWMQDFGNGIQSSYLKSNHCRARAVRRLPLWQFNNLSKTSDTEVVNHATGIERIAAERRRQISREGFDAHHDANHGGFELTLAAICYANQARMLGVSMQQGTPHAWPTNWHPSWWKPEPRNKGGAPVIEHEDAIRMLEKSGALIAAEIDRLIRGYKEVS